MMRWLRGLLIVAAVLTPAPAAAAAAPPLAQIGAPIGDGPSGSLLHPTTLRATFRVPAADTALYLATNWEVRDLAVTVVGVDGARRRIVADAALPGRMLGLRLPADAARAARIELTAHAISNGGVIYLVRAEKLAVIGWRSWWYSSFFGLFAGLALLHGILAVTLRLRAYAWYALVMAADAALTIDHLGIMRPSPEVSQPLNIVVSLAGLLGTLLFVTAFAGGRLPRALVALLALGLATVAVHTIGGDVLGDQWPVSDALAQALALPWYAALLGAAGLAVRRRVDGAAYLVAGLACSVVGGVLSGLVDTVRLYEPLFQSASWVGSGLEATFLALALSVRLRRTETERMLFGRLAKTDGLTGLANRAAFDARLQEAWQRAGRARRPLAALMIDVDAFKRYNDSYGHPAGDEVLRRVAGRLAAVAARADDVVARYGGEEFVVLLPVTDLAAAAERAEAARRAVAELAIPHRESAAGRVTISIGAAALIPDGAAGASELIARADAALYEAKRLGRDRVVADGARPAEPAAALR